MNAQKLKERLETKGIKVEFEVKQGKVQNISFTRDDFQITSVKGVHRNFTKTVMNNLEKNREAFRAKQFAEQKQVEDKKQLVKEQIQEVRNIREEKTKLQAQNMYSNKGLSR